MSTPFIPHDAPWASLDELVEAWTVFSGEALTAPAARAISEAFAAIAQEREALHLLTAEEHARPRTHCEAIDWHHDSIACFARAATHWYQAAAALAEGTMEYLYDQATTQQQVYHPLITSALVERLRVWALAQRLMQEQVQWYPSSRRTDAAGVMSGCGHAWLAGLAVGEWICSVCGSKARCPVCVPTVPEDGVTLMHCPKHRQPLAVSIHGGG